VRQGILALAISAILVVVSVPVRADDDELTRPSLAGLKGIAVSVGFSCNACEAGAAPVEINLDEEVIRTDVELKLRKTGIPLVAKEKTETLLAEDGAFLHVMITIIGVDSTVYGFHLELEVEQPARLRRAPSALAPLAVTWSVGVSGVVGKERVRAIRDNLGDLTDRFLNAFLSVNPR
jgi:hypothetical protein